MLLIHVPKSNPEQDRRDEKILYFHLLKTTLDSGWEMMYRLFHVRAKKLLLPGYTPCIPFFVNNTNSGVGLTGLRWSFFREKHGIEGWIRQFSNHRFIKLQNKDWFLSRDWSTWCKSSCRNSTPRWKNTAYCHRYWTWNALYAYLSWQRPGPWAYNNWINP